MINETAHSVKKHFSKFTKVTVLYFAFSVFHHCCGVILEWYHSRSLSRSMRELNALCIICCVSQCCHKQGLPCPLHPPERVTVGSHSSSPDRLPERNHLAPSWNGLFQFWGRPRVKMRKAWLFKSWANSQTFWQHVPQGPLILGSWSVALNGALCSFHWIVGVSFLLNSLICSIYFTCCVMLLYEVKWEHVVSSV